MLYGLLLSLRLDGLRRPDVVIDPSRYTGLLNYAPSRKSDPLHDEPA